MAHQLYQGCLYFYSPHTAKGSKPHSYSLFFHQPPQPSTRVAEIGITGGMHWHFLKPSLALLLLLPQIAFCQDGDEAASPIFKDDTAITTLAAGKTLRGVVGKDEVELLAFSVPKRKGSFPDITLVMEIENVAADADLYCLPWMVTQRAAAVPSPQLAVWRSSHTQGEDIVFISRQHPAFETSITTTQTGDGGSEKTAEIICSIVGHSVTPSRYAVSMDVVYEPRELVSEEADAIQDIFDACCPDLNSCLRWPPPAGGSPAGVDRSIALDFCNVLGSVCDEDGHLVRLDMQNYGLTCEMPSKALGKMSKLKKLMLSNNFLTGDIDKIMKDLQALPDLDQVSLRKNEISGFISGGNPRKESATCVIAKQSLEFLNLDFNDVKGPLPSCLFERESNLHVLFLDSNPINSEIPDIFRQNSLIEYLSIAEAGMFGKFPETLALVPNLVSLDLKSNALEGNLPEMFGETPFISTINLDNNLLSGSIPSPFASSKSLRFLGLSNNSFSSMPDMWSDAVSANENLLQVNLADNELEGSFPLALALAPNLTGLDLHNNQISGELPDAKGMFPKAISVVLSNNEFSGVIPDSWGKIGMFSTNIISRDTSYLDLSGNGLTGPLPEFLLDGNNIPFPLSFGGINLAGNDFECYKADEITQMAHLEGLKECSSATSDSGGEAPAEAPIVIPAEAPAEAPAEVPAEAPAEVPAEAPAEVPAESSSDSSAVNAESTSAEEQDTINLTEEGVVESSIESEAIQDDSLTATSLSTNEVESESQTSRKKSPRSSSAKAPLAIGLVIAGIVVLAAVAAVATVLIKRHKRQKELTLRTDVEMGRSGAKAMQGVKFEEFQNA